VLKTRASRLICHAHCWAGECSQPTRRIRDLDGIENPAFPPRGFPEDEVRKVIIHGVSVVAGIDGSEGSEGTTRPRRSSMASRAISETWPMVMSVASVPSRKAK
jgi:hypothetical protein